MSNIDTQCFARSQPFPVEWPMAAKTCMKSKNLKKDVQKTKGIKKRKTRRPSRSGSSQTGLVTHTMTAEQEMQTDDSVKRSAYEVHGDSDQTEYNVRETLTGGTDYIIYEPAMTQDVVPNVFECLDTDEARWLAEEVHLANKSIIGTERTAEKLNSKLEDKKSSLDALQNLLKDLRWNIKYPDEEIAKNLDSLDEASRSFGVRNMVNCLSLLDGYFSELQTQLDK